MAIKPILFNTDMVRAILDGRKTCTRRVVKPQWEECPQCKYMHKEYVYDKLAQNVYCARCGYPLVPERKSPYQPGDILYVRETWYKRLERYMYRADYSDAEKFYRNGKEIKMKWHPSMRELDLSKKIALVNLIIYRSCISFLAGYGIRPSRNLILTATDGMRTLTFL